MKDPISDSNSKVAMLKEHCDGVIIKELDAGSQSFLYLSELLYNKVLGLAFKLTHFLLDIYTGHCPHDEVPERVNTIICEWIIGVESKILVECPV